MAKRSRLRGDVGFRKMIRKLPDAARDEMANLLGDLGNELLQAMRADVPVKTGALRAGLAAKLLRKSLRLRVGLPPQRLRGGNLDLFYGRIVEFGRKAQTVNVTRRKNAAPYKMRVRAMAPRPFVFKRRPQLRGEFGGKIKTFWDRTLADAAEGIGLE